MTITGLLMFSSLYGIKQKRSYDLTGARQRMGNGAKNGFYLLYYSE